jgi:hypothetical protein
LREASSVITTSKPWGDKLSRILDKDVEVITSGYLDEEKSRLSLNSYFSIVYTGSIYPKKQSLRLFLEGLKESELREISVSFYGPKSTWIDREIERLGLESVAKQRGNVSHSSSLKLQKQAQVLLYLDWIGDPGVYSYKLFEYLGSRRPILAVGENPGSVVDYLLKETNSGRYASTIDEVSTSLNYYSASFEILGATSYKGKEIDKYSAKEMARKFVELFER